MWVFVVVLFLWGVGLWGGGGGPRKRGGEKGVRTVGGYKIVNSLTVAVIRYQLLLLVGDDNFLKSRTNGVTVTINNFLH